MVCAGLDGFTQSSESDKASLVRNLVLHFLPNLSLIAFWHASPPRSSLAVPQQQPSSLSSSNLDRTVTPNDYGSIIVAPLVKLFASADRGTRIALLDSLPDFAEKLDKKTVVDKIWPNLVCHIFHLSHSRSYCLRYRPTLYNGVLGHLVPFQSDPEASIRTNTCILIGRLGPSPGYAECFKMEDITGKVVSAVVGATLDKEKLVRNQAFKAVELFVKRLEAHAATMVDLKTTEEGGDDLQLGGNKALTSTLAAQLAEEVANEAGQGSSHLWNDDLIDIHADEGDWTAFESTLPTIESKLASTTDAQFGISLRASSPTSDEWGAMLSFRSTSPDPWTTPYPSHISRTLSPQPRRSLATSILPPAFPPASSTRLTPVSSPRPLPNSAEHLHSANQDHDVLLEERTLLQSQVNFNQGAIMQLQKKLGEVASELSSSDCVLQNVHSNLRATKSRDTFISKLKLARCESMDREADAAQVQKEVNSWQEKDTVSLQQSIIELQQGYAEL
ncbi:hypothetical protein P692DRAFT_20877927 [Suillus brevipes Sb2]|nr:hypothetical protein P692DRAFT_20877927 [Suillus brevipes Sb2]